MLDIRELFNKIKIKHIWIFLTERCNLNCDYCFFKHRTNSKTLSLKQMEILLGLLNKYQRYDFVISGGEPLLEWDLSKEVIDYIRYTFPNCILTLQTNGILINKEHIEYLKRNRVTLEVGIDGRFLSNARHRRGTNKQKYKKITDALAMAIENKLDINPTMAIHPEEIAHMFDSFEYLISLGLYSVDVHPAFLESWNARQISLFRNEYMKIIDYERKSKKYLVNKQYDIPMNLSFDLVVLPDGNILPNWVYLSLPERIRKKHVFMKLSKKGLMVYRTRLSDYLKKYREYFRESNVTYRDFSIKNAEIMLKDTSKKSLRKNLGNYKLICKFLKKIDQMNLRKEDWVQ